jgi:hypothetical protein
MADAAAQAVANAELLLSVAASERLERSVMIDNQLRVFEAYEYGLLATCGDSRRAVLRADGHSRSGLTNETWTEGHRSSTGAPRGSNSTCWK